MFRRKKKLKYYLSIVEKSNLFDNIFYLKTYSDARQADMTPIEHFVTFGLKEDRKPNADFDPTWYREFYQDIKADGGYPFIHYCLYGKNENRLTNITQADSLSIENIEPEQNTGQKQEIKISRNLSLDDHEKYIYSELEKLNINFDYYFEDNRHATSCEDPLEDYIKNWHLAKPVIRHTFDTSLYLDFYPDIKNNNVNPLFHFMMHGINEGRIGYIDLDRYIKIGLRDHDPNKENIIFVSHESSATGAPLLGYNIIDELSEYNVIHIVMRKEKLHEMFSSNVFLLIEDILQNPYLLTKYLVKKLLDEYEIKCALCNSIVTSQVSDALREISIPSLVLVHEFADYTRPLGRMSKTVFNAEKLIVPANIIKQSILSELKEEFAIVNEPLNVEIMPQGKLPVLSDDHGNDESVSELLDKLGVTDKDHTKIIVASGYVQIRKGTDLFIQLAKKVKDKINAPAKFVWVGGGYDPINDTEYSTWLKRELDISHLDDDFIFLDHQKNLDNIFSIADLFCLTSRLDPFPNVVIDALSHDLPVACFDNATGSSEFLEQTQAVYITAPYLDVDILSERIVKYFSDDKISKGLNKQIVNDFLDFKAYVNHLKIKMKDVIDIHHDNIRDYHLITEHKAFDPFYYGSEGDATLACLEYINRSRNNISAFNPKPGFNELLWRTQNDISSNEIPLVQALKQNTYFTHDCRILTSNTNKKVNFIYAVHLHLYYVDLADEFVEYFKNLSGAYDLYITIVNEDAYSDTVKKFSLCGAREVFVKTVENIGRDVGPMLFELRDMLLSENYEVIGHFHSKKSVSTDNDMGDRWRRYILDIMIGYHKDSREVLGLFDESSVGLVFPEDMHAMNIGENVEFIASLCEMMDIDPVSEIPIFPLGNMFWARTNAIKDLFMLDKEQILQDEPLPYDGSYMHALERIIPSVVTKNGFTYTTVYKKGMRW